MSLFELFILAIGLSMDAFAVSICKGLALKNPNFKTAGIIGLYFGLFQAGMPLIGYSLGVRFQSNITAIDHWIAFVLLLLIGANMMKEALSKDQESGDDSLCFRKMIVLAIATSIDALAVGVTFAFLKVEIIPAVSFIGIITFGLSIVGVKIGTVFGIKYKSKAEFTGGIILIFMGVKILLQHLGFTA
ncbi:MAG: manganese efflux pump MntP family protein [Lachnotalea sp.]